MSDRAGGPSTTPAHAISNSVYGAVGRVPVFGAVTTDPDELLRAFHDHTLPKPAWTHEAHVSVCWATLAQQNPADALDHLRTAIRSYNESVGTANTDTDGYHETITRYYVGAVAALRDRPLVEVLAHPTCSRTAALEHWSRDLLFSVAARHAWVEPDLHPLPWIHPN